MLIAIFYEPIKYKCQPLLNFSIPNGLYDIIWEVKLS